MGVMGLVDRFPAAPEGIKRGQETNEKRLIINHLRIY